MHPVAILGKINLQCILYSGFYLRGLICANFAMNHELANEIITNNNMQFANLNNSKYLLLLD